MYTHKHRNLLGMNVTYFIAFLEKLGMVDLDLYMYLHDYIHQLETSIAGAQVVYSWQ